MARIRKNNILAKNRQGKKAIGCAFVFPCVEIVELVGMNGGFDYISLDGEHGLFSPESIDSMCRAADGVGLTVTARIPRIDSSTVNTFLDRGVMGILAPHLETPEQARALVDACRFGPEGSRSWGGARGTYYNDRALLENEPSNENTEFMREANKEMLVMAQLESVPAFDNLDAILEVPGIDVFAWGSNDLSQSMGHPGQPQHPEVIEIQRKAAERIHAAGRRLETETIAPMHLAILVLEGARKFLAENE